MIMTEKYFSAEQAAQILNMHIKTVQRYIREGKLKANKVGKSWRITGHDLSVFAEGEKLNPRESAQPAMEIKALVSDVADIQNAGKEDAMRIMNTMTAAMNVKPPEYGDSTLHMQYLEQTQTVRIMLWGNLPFMESMMGCLSMLTQRDEQGV
jgi:excisionase family DNA binding protein